MRKRHQHRARTPKRPKRPIHHARVRHVETKPNGYDLYDLADYGYAIAHGFDDDAVRLPEDFSLALDPLLIYGYEPS